MCKSPIKITVSATTANPFPPSLSDGTNTSTGLGDENFTTDVSAGDKVQFLVGENVTKITAITETVGNLFSQDPSAANNWTGVVKGSKPGTIADYSISYDVSGAPNNPYTQDPKLRMN